MKLNNRHIITLALVVVLILIVASVADAYQRYTVQQGDSLFTISQKFSISISSLIDLNNIDNPNLILTGDRLTVPALSTGSSSNNERIVNNSNNNSSRNNSNNRASFRDSAWQSRENNKAVVAQKETPVERKLYRRGPNTMRAALTFDDGPDAVYTPQVLDVLREYNIKATFFLVGQRVEKHPDVVRQILKDGHTIANHSWSHADLRRISEERVEEEVMRTEKALEKVISRKTAMIRPPYGAVSNKVLKQLYDMNYSVVNWSVDSLDWRAKDKSEVIERTIPNLHGGANILFHSAGGEGQSLRPTVEALAIIIEELQKRNIEMVTVDELLSIPAYKR
ncbi:polysaccharide deacetylase family protein [Halonatronum saccharophilum]|uniref:polysaccharide deacetylase family protein n=1 Tax=Halonatronum saccharophilum TaxID=150060 RepID=UPI0004B48C75|nr:polysaccharide deacetylase family protein [Halonatronum saccharophilum]